ncbi:hypothetical protein OG791_26310 [Streptomyces canus]|nr:hypothetical protein [Streptomyces canus]
MKSWRTAAPTDTGTVRDTVSADPEPSAGRAVSLKVYVPLGTSAPLLSRVSQRAVRLPSTSPPESVRTTAPVALLVSVAVHQQAQGHPE